MNSDITMAIDAYPWESQEQKEGFLAFVQYGRKFGLEVELPLNPVVAFFVQKNHEAQEYFRDLIGGQVSDLQNQIKILQEKLAQSDERASMLLELYKSQNSTVQLLSKRST